MLKRNDKRRAAWFAEFESIVIAALPETAGRLDWNTATFFLNSGLTAAAAADRFIKRETGKA